MRLELAGIVGAGLPCFVLSQDRAGVSLVIHSHSVAERPTIGMSGRVSRAGARGDYPPGREVLLADKLITVPARVATSARRITLHLPTAWPWETAWTALFDRVSDPPATITT